MSENLLSVPSINLLVFHSFFSHPCTSNSPRQLSIKCSFRLTTRTTTITAMTRGSIPATDRVIDFGKHKGKMLGALPSSYLRWLSRNLRAREFEEWAKLADEVLRDPIYQDRIEWEFAENVLNGNRSTSSSTTNELSAVSKLLELSERLGWDNKDKVGWSRVNFELLGTSKGGRLPRIAHKKGEENRNSDGNTIEKENDALSEGGERRRERRQRVRLKREVGVREYCKKVMRTDEENGRDECVDAVDRMKREEGERSGKVVKFPGREGLLKKVLKSRRRV